MWWEPEFTDTAHARCVLDKYDYKRAHASVCALTQTHPQKYVILIAFSTTKMVTWRRLNLTSCNITIPSAGFLPFQIPTTAASGLLIFAHRNTIHRELTAERRWRGKWYSLVAQMIVQRKTAGAVRKVWRCTNKAQDRAEPSLLPTTRGARAVAGTACRQGTQVWLTPTLCPLPQDEGGCCLHRQGRTTP